MNSGHSHPSRLRVACRAPTCATSTHRPLGVLPTGRAAECRWGEHRVPLISRGSQHPLRSTRTSWVQLGCCHSVATPYFPAEVWGPGWANSATTTPAKEVSVPVDPAPSVSAWRRRSTSPAPSTKSPTTSGPSARSPAALAVGMGDRLIAHHSLAEVSAEPRQPLTAPSREPPQATRRSRRASAARHPTTGS